MIFMCDPRDGKHEGRMKLFKRWFGESQSLGIEKYDASLESECNVIYHSLLIQTSHSHKVEIVSAYYQLTDDIQGKWDSS